MKDKCNKGAAPDGKVILAVSGQGPGSGQRQARLLFGLPTLRVAMSWHEGMSEMSRAHLGRQGLKRWFLSLGPAARLFSALNGTKPHDKTIAVLGGFWHGSCMIIGYARVSTDDQSLDGQLDALGAAGAAKIFADKITGTARSRPELDRLLDQLRGGDVVVVTKYDRLARSLRDLLDIVDAVQARGAGFRSLAEEIDTTTPAGRLIFHVFASIAQFERERIAERTREGLAAARKRGRVGGRPPALSPAQKDEVRRMRDTEARPLPEIAGLFRVSVKTIRRA